MAFKADFGLTKRSGRIVAGVLLGAVLVGGSGFAVASGAGMFTDPVDLANERLADCLPEDLYAEIGFQPHQAHVAATFDGDTVVSIPWVNPMTSGDINVQVDRDDAGEWRVLFSHLTQLAVCSGSEPEYQADVASGEIADWWTYDDGYFADILHGELFDRERKEG